jgi:uncharacterized protein with HEPN domain
MKNEVYKKKLNARDEYLAPILDAATRIKKYMINSDEQHAIFKHELQSALMLTLEFWKIYCKL